MLHYKFINSHLIFVNLVDVSFSNANSGKQTLVGIYIIYIILYIYLYIHNTHTHTHTHTEKFH